MSDEEFSVESLKKSMEAVGQLYPRLVNQEGKVLDGDNRTQANKEWETKTIETKSRRDEILIRLHAHHRRRMRREETQSLILELAQELEKSGIPKENISVELVKLLPYSEGYIRQLLPVEYKKEEMVQRAQISVLEKTAETPKEAQIEPQKPSMPPLPCSVGGHVNLVYPKFWQGRPVCENHFNQLNRGEITLETPKLSKPSIKEVPKPSHVEKKIYEPGAWKERMHPPVSRMEEAVFRELQRQNIPVISQEPVCIRFVVPDIIIQKGDKPIAVFIDGKEVHKKRTLIDEENREMLAKRGYHVLQLEYESYTEEEKEAILSDILSVIQ